MLTPENYIEQAHNEKTKIAVLTIQKRLRIQWERLRDLPQKPSAEKKSRRHIPHQNCQNRQNYLSS